MTVQELINQLNQVEDKSKTVFAFLGDCEFVGDINSIDMVDELDDRVDINFVEYK